MQGGHFRNLQTKTQTQAGQLEPRLKTLNSYIKLLYLPNGHITITLQRVYN